MDGFLAKMMEEKHTYTYKKLVVPMSMRSIYWKYFGFPATDDGEILTKVKIVCILCKTQIAYNRNTSNLRMHLQNKHSQELMVLEASSPPRRLNVDAKEKRALKKMKSAASHIYTTVTDGTVQIEGGMQFITDPNISLKNVDDDNTNQNVRVVLKGNNSALRTQNVAIILPEEHSNSQMQDVIDGKTISDAIAEFVILDMQHPDVVDGRGFQKLLATIRSPCEIPQRNKLEEELIPRIYDTFKEAVQYSVMRHTGEVGLSIEEWNLANGEAYLTVSVHFQLTSDPVMETHILSSFHCSSDMDAEVWSITFDSLFSEWEIKIGKISAVVAATSREEIIASLMSKGITVVPCLVHTLQTCMAACFEQLEMSVLLNKCRSLLAYISRSSSASATLRLQDQTLEVDNVLKIDYPRIWMSTYLMLEQLFIRREILPIVIEVMDAVDKDLINLTEVEWKMIEDVVTVLEPFKVTIETLSEEKVPLASLLNPLLWQLNTSHLKITESDSRSAQNFKSLISQQLTAKYSDPDINRLLQKATALDPRFKLLQYSSEKDKNAVFEPIKETLISYIREERDEISQDDCSSHRKNRVSGMEFLLGNLCTTRSGMPAEERANLELVQYQSEGTASLDHCPLQWWSKMSAKCPHLARMARKYNCIPATAIPPVRIPVENQVAFDMKRANLPPEIVDKILFLNGNHTE